jgi:hypothetical protein
MNTPPDPAAAATQAAATAKSAADAAVADADSAKKAKEAVAAEAQTISQTVKSAAAAAVTDAESTRKAKDAATADALAIAQVAADIVTPAVTDALAAAATAAVSAAVTTAMAAVTAPAAQAPAVATNPPVAQATGGEAIVVPLEPDEIRFINDTAHPQLDQVTSLEQLKHFADLWWNLCLWEKQRADAVDSKAQMLLGLSGIATALLGTSGLTATPEGYIRAVAVGLFLLTVALSVWALRIRQYAGFVDSDIFNALSSHAKPVPVTPPFRDGKPFECYLREIALQRWFIYKSYKKASGSKTGQIQLAQGSACAAVVLTGISVLHPIWAPLCPLVAHSAVAAFAWLAHLLQPVHQWLIAHHVMT